MRKHRRVLNEKVHVKHKLLYFVMFFILFLFFFPSAPELHLRLSCPFSNAALRVPMRPHNPHDALNVK